MDSLTLQKIETAHPKLRDELKQIYGEICSVLTGRVKCRFPFVFRTIKEQDELYAQGRTKLFDTNGKRLGVVTQVKGGGSFHNYGLAVDIVMLIDTDGNGTFETASWDTKKDSDKDGMSDWMECVTIFKKYGWEWGGDWKKFKDAPHFQKTFGYTTSQLRKLPSINGYPQI
jgi:peptidoglycan L-alanyl-D-glutamate endopeptidase CwlK